jgi:hypothetical protein
MTFMSTKILSTLGVLLLLFAGCAGRNHLLFMTKSNVGLDFDSKPPTLEITVSRKEAVIAPTFEGGQTPPVVASFKPKATVSGWFANFFLGVDQTFSGGDAAVAMSALYASSNNPPASTAASYDSSLHLTQPPRYPDVFRRIPGPGETRAFIFGTDSSLGLKAAWSGAGGQFPDTVRLGYNRKEFAWAPVTLTTNTGSTNGTNQLPTTYIVKTPSFLATIESEINVGNSNGGIKSLQYFASGESATLLALQPEVRKAMIKRLDPEVAALAYNYVDSPEGDCLRKFWKPDGTNINAANNVRLRAWMGTNGVPTPAVLFRAGSNEALRQKAIKDLEIDCD